MGKTYRNYYSEEMTAELPIRTITREDRAYPEKLRYLERMPDRLYVRGAMPAPQKKCVAIVGARNCSQYGKMQALHFGEVLAAHDVVVISGMAYGIDSWAHEGALRGGGQTIAVVGCGVDICYPKSNHNLYQQILATGGGIVSEFEAKTEPNTWHFPLRNRIISGLADIVLVVEAKEKSGSLITADYALEQGKTVFAIPGRVGDSLSSGTNRLIMQGAGIAMTPEVLLAELGIESGRKVSGMMNGGKRTQKKRGGNDERSRSYSPDFTHEHREEDFPIPEELSQKKTFRKVMQHIKYEEVSLDYLLECTGLPLQTLSALLMQLQISGFLTENPPGFYCRRC